MSTTDRSVSDPFVEVPLRPRFFQASAFFPMPIVLLGTRGPDGAPNLAPYSLCFPHVTAQGHRLVLVTRASSKTAGNLLRTGRITVNFIPDEPVYLANIKLLSAAVSTTEKMARSIFTLVPSTRAPGLDGSEPPPLVAEAIQVFECSLVSVDQVAEAAALDGTPEASSGPDGEHRFVLEVERIAMWPRWVAALEAGRGSPRLPVDYGFRRASDTWLSRPRTIVSGPRLRPSFEIEVERSAERVKADFVEALLRPGATVAGKARGDVIQLTMPKEQLNTWSPHVDMRVDPKPDGAGSIVRGRIGPQPQVWTTFMFFHLLIAFTGLGALMWGVSQALAGESAFALWGIPIALFLHAFVAGAAFIGQGLAADQTHTLRSFLDDVLTE